MVLILANALVPIFIGLLLGYGAGVSKLVDNKDVKSLIVFLMNFALPCSLFATIAHSSRTMLLSQGKSAAVLLVVYLVVYCATYFGSRAVGEAEVDSAVSALTLGFPNATAVGLPLLSAVFGPETVVSAVVAIAVGAVTISPITLALLESNAAPQGASVGAQFGRCLSRVSRQPICWSPLLGILFVFANLHVPVYLDKTLLLIGNATAGVALFVTGLVVSAQRFTFSWKVLAATGMKNFVQPMLCVAVGLMLRMPRQELCYVVLIGAIPCGFFGVVFGKRFGVAANTASSSLIVSYLAGIFSLAMWIVLLKHFYVSR